MGCRRCRCHLPRRQSPSRDVINFLDGTKESSQPDFFLLYQNADRYLLRTLQVSCSPACPPCRRSRKLSGGHHSRCHNCTGRWCVCACVWCYCDRCQFIGICSRRDFYWYFFCSDCGRSGFHWARRHKRCHQHHRYRRQLREALHRKCRRCCLLCSRCSCCRCCSYWCPDLRWCLQHERCPHMAHCCCHGCRCSKCAGWGHYPIYRHQFHCWCSCSSGCGRSNSG